MVPEAAAPGLEINCFPAASPQCYSTQRWDETNVLKQLQDVFSLVQPAPTATPIFTGA